MPPRNPNADDNDPLWPKKFEWPGGRLAPQRKASPPLPPGIADEPPNEKYPWIVDPANRPAAPPKGDVQTGEKVGPAYTKAPRDVQRGWVDTAFKDLVNKPETAFTTARAMEGSVFDTPADRSIRDLSLGSVPAGVVSNPANVVFQDLLKRVPRFAGALQKMRPITEYIPHKAGDFTRNTMGVTTGVKPGGMESLARFAQTGRILPGPVKRSAEELGRLYNLNTQRAGSTIQSMRPTLKGAEAEVTPIHEGFHSIYSQKFPGSQMPEMADARARELLARTLSRSGINPVEQASIMMQYSQDPQHGLVEALAQFVNQKAKHGMGVR